MFLEVHLGYYKQGDDLANHIEGASSAADSFRAHAEQLQAVVEHLNKLADMVQGHEIDLEASTHFIGIECDDELGQRLIDAELADKDDFEDEDVEEEKDEDFGEGADA